MLTSPQELTGGPRPEDILSSIRSGPTAPVQKSQDVIVGQFVAQSLKKINPIHTHRYDLHDPKPKSRIPGRNQNKTRCP